MKRQYKFRIAVFLASALFISNSFGQQSVVNNLQSSLDDKSVKVYENVVSKFRENFKNAEDVRWEKIRHHFLATFSLGDTKKRTLFNRKGRLIYEITLGKEKLLPVHTRKNVKSIYVEYLITSAALIEEGNRRIWVINLEDDSNYVIVRVENDEMEEVKKYRKSLTVGTGN